MFGKNRGQGRGRGRGEEMRAMRMQQQLDRRMKQQKGNSAPDLYRNIKSNIPTKLMPGNVGDINRVIWPFWFTFTAPELQPNQTSQASFSVTQEAAFIWMAFSKVVFKRTGGGPYSYTAIDSNQEDPSVGEANGLTFQFRDAQSSRVFSQQPVPIDAFGDPNFPSVLQTPVMFLPNSTVECLYSNSDSSAIYVPHITMFGYRVRLENAEQILSMVTG